VASSPLSVKTNSRFLRAARREPVDRTPIWMMRQAGRSLPEYRALRDRWKLVDIVAQQELCAEVTLQPVRRLGVDAAVMFADIMLPLTGMGVGFELVEDVGPVIAEPVRSPADVDRLRVPEGDEAAPQVITAVRQVVAESPVPVVCFSGGPFTLASYLVEGRPTRDFKLVKAFMYQEPDAFDSLLGKLTDTAIGYLGAQVRAGAAAIQLFDSWIGALSADDYAERVLPHSRRLLAALEELGVPRIHFGVNTGGLLELMSKAGPDIVGVDWHVPLDVAWARVGDQFGVQGNLDPAALLAPVEVLRAKAQDVLRRAAGRPGHVFNLGHGVLPETPIESLHALVETVHAWEPRG